jgi:3-hydroxyisobutyrate dehydrogenase-like beta-hydroxyacid dehydrogenase
MMRRVGILHPGAMGGAVGAALVARGVEVRWASEGRSPATRRRADAGGLVDAGSVAAVLEASDVVLCICPPDAAVDVAEDVAAQRFAGTYVDANAVSPATARRIASIVSATGAVFVDGDLIGGPPRPGGKTRLYLSGSAADELLDLLSGPGLEAVVIGSDVAAASSLKMCYASWTKGTAGLLLAIRAIARELGVEEPLLAEWDRTQPGLRERSDGAVGSVPKAWRFVGEMEEIAATFAASGQPDGFARGAAEIYSRLTEFKDAGATLDEALDALRR